MIEKCDNITVDYAFLCESGLRNSSRILLTSDETACLKWIVKGKRNKQIADLMNVRKRSVERYCQSIKSKLNVKTMPEAVAKAIIHGLIDDWEY